MTITLSGRTVLIGLAVALVVAALVVFLVTRGPAFSPTEFDSIKEGDSAASVADRLGDPDFREGPLGPQDFGVPDYLRGTALGGLRVGPSWIWIHDDVEYAVTFEGTEAVEVSGTDSTACSEEGAYHCGDECVVPDTGELTACDIAGAIPEADYYQSRE